MFASTIFAALMVATLMVAVMVAIFVVDALIVAVSNGRCGVRCGRMDAGGKFDAENLMLGGRER